MPQGPSLALHTDHYEITMAAAALHSGAAGRRAVFEVFTRRLPEGRAYGVVAGTGRAVEAIERFRFDSAAVDHLVSTGVVDNPDVADWLRSYRFGGDVVGYPDGELFFPYSPVLTVEGAFAECVLLETSVLSILNHDCAVASAAARMRDAAGSRMLLEGGSRRTNPEAAVSAARAAYIGGFDATSNLESGRRWGLPTGGTTAHAFILAHDDERAAFAAQRDTLGAGSTYLVDTFDVAEAIRCAVEVVGPGIGAVRIDSGDLLASSAHARHLLDELGAAGCRIVASGDLDELKIAELEQAGAPVDAYLVGTSLVTGSGHPTASMVYKLVSIESGNAHRTPQRQPTASEPLTAGTAGDTGEAPEEDGATATGATLSPVCKHSADKATVGGRKQAYRTVGPNGFLLSETLSPDAQARPADPLPDRVLSPDEQTRPPAGLWGPGEVYSPQIVMMVEGRTAYADDTAEARRRRAERLEALRPCDRAVHPLNSPAVPTLWSGWAPSPGATTRQPTATV